MGPKSSARGVLTRLAIAVAASFFGASHAGPGSDEYSVKAAMIWNFTKFVEWPTGLIGDRSIPFVIGVYGDDPFAGKLEATVRGKDVNGHAVTIKKLQTIGADCRAKVVFVAESMKSRWKDLGILQGKPILVIGESEAFVKGTGHIAFVKDDRRVAFVIGNKAAQSSGLAISSKLLALAKKVDP